MESLQIKTGAISLNILDDAGNNRGVFTFNPKDLESAKQVFAIQQDFEGKQQEFEDRIKLCTTTEEKVNLMAEVVDYMEESIDKCFGEGSSLLLFGKAKTLSMFDDFFQGIMPYYKKESNARMAKYKK